MSDRHPRSLRQQDRDPVAAFHAARPKRVREAVRALSQRPVSQGRDLPVGADFENRGAAGLRRRPAVADVDADVVALGNAPSERRDEAVVIRSRGEHRGAQSAFRSAAGGRNWSSKISSGLGFALYGKARPIWSSARSKRSRSMPPKPFSRAQGVTMFRSSAMTSRSSSTSLRASSL